jgi:hypothetical protein
MQLSFDGFLSISLFPVKEGAMRRFNEEECASKFFRMTSFRLEMEIG